MSPRRRAKRPGAVEQIHTIKLVARELRAFERGERGQDWRAAVLNAAATLEQAFCARGAA
jgi:hypothetical protein